MQPTVHSPLLRRNITDRPSNFTLAGIPEVPFYGREFDVVLHTCTNAICACGSMVLFFYMPDLLGTKHFSFRIHGDALERRLDTDEYQENAGGAARMLGFYLTPADWDTIEQEWSLTKAMLIEHLDPRNLDFTVEFPAKFRRDPSEMIAFSSIFALSYPYQATFREKVFDLLDMYCANSACRCTSALFSFASTEKEHFFFGYNYRTRDIQIEAKHKGHISVEEAEGIVAHLNTRYPGFDKFIENRNEVLRALHAADLKRHPLPEAKFAAFPAKTPLLPPKAAEVGRNAPCPCGSGKKYKRCCGS